MAEEAIRDYYALIERSPSLLDELRELLLARFHEARFVFGGRTLSPYLRPHFLTPAEWQHITTDRQLRTYREIGDLKVVVDRLIEESIEGVYN